MRDRLSEWIRRWYARGIPPEDLRGPDDPESIEAEDLAAYLIRMARQPGRSAVTICFVGRTPTPEDTSPRVGTWAVRWWN
jgi:hypothetical protein